MLETHQLASGYGKMTILRDIGIRIDDGEVVAIVGANGAGKTTLVRTICGLIAPSAGKIIKNGTDLTHVPTHKRMRHGIAVVLENRRLWGELTVRENLRLAEVNARSTASPRITYEDAAKLFPIIAERHASPVELLSGGEQQMVAIARALMTNPALLLLDEPMEGLAPIIVQELGRAIRALVGEGGMAVIVVEQHARLALELTQRALVLDRGRIVHASASADLLADAPLLQRLVSVA